MRLSWFRMHTEARTDAKLRSLTAEQFRVWFNLLCLAAEQDESRGVIADVDLELLAIEVADGDAALLEQTLARLVKLRIIAQTDGVVAFLNFEKRQYDKPSSTPERVRERVRQYRERRETPNTSHVTPGNAHVTPGNAESRGDKSIPRDTANAVSTSDGADASSDPSPVPPSLNGLESDISDEDLAAMLEGADVANGARPNASPVAPVRATHRQNGALALSVPVAAPPAPAKRATAPKPLLPEHSAPIELARAFRDALRAQLPDARVPADTVAALQGWGRHFDLMIRVDKRGTDEIRRMIAFARTHTFWRKNILSPENLRDKWNRLAMERQEQEAHRGTHGRYSGANGGQPSAPPNGAGRSAPRNTINGYVPSRHTQAAQAE